MIDDENGEVLSAVKSSNEKGSLYFCCKFSSVVSWNTRFCLNWGDFV